MSVSDTAAWIRANRASHERFAALVAPLTDTEVTAASYATEWSIADVASHLGSQAEIFGLFLEAGLTGAAAPADFGPVWDRWNALPPARQVADSVAASEAFTAALEKVPEDEWAAFGLALFGMDTDLARLLAMRVGEHAVHTWDIAVALDPAATILPEVVDLVVDTLGVLAGRAGEPAPGVPPVAVETTAPERRLLLTVDPAVTLADGDGPDPLRLPAEAFTRLVYGRLDPDHTPASVAADSRLDTLRAVFPGF